MRASAKRFFAFVTSTRTRSPGQGAGDEDDEAVGPGDAAPAEGERVDLDLELLAPARAAGRRLLAAGCRQLSRVSCAARRAAWVACLRTGSAAAADLFARLLDQPLELAEQRVGLLAAAFDQVAEHLLGVAAGHPAALDGVVDDLLQAVAAERDAVLEALAELRDALVEAARRFAAGAFRRRFFGRRFFR